MKITCYREDAVLGVLHLVDIYIFFVEVGLIRYANLFCRNKKTGSKTACQKPVSHERKNAYGIQPYLRYQFRSCRKEFANVSEIKI